MFQVTEKIYRGPRPSKREKIQELKDSGFKAIINLTDSVQEIFADDEYEVLLVEDWGMDEINIECSTILPPRHWQVEKFFHAVELYEKVYVHCKMGVDRTGYMIACYRILKQGWSFKDAVSEMFNRGFNKLPYIVWLPSLFLQTRK